jgi:hypothetical protein
MKPHWTLLLAAAWLVAPAFAQNEAPEKPRARKGPQAQQLTREQASANSYRARIEHIRKRLKLDEQQQEQFDRIAAEFLEQRPGDADRERQRELLEKIRAAREADDWKQVRELQAELRSIRTGRPMAEFYDQIAPILNDEQLDTLAEIRARAASERGRARGPLAQLEQLRAQLSLNDEQSGRYDELYAALEEKIGQARGDSAETRELIRQLTEAKDAGDEARVKELMEQLPDPRGESEMLIADFLNKVDRFLEPEQKEILAQFQREIKQQRSRVDLRDCFRFVSRLELDQQQRQTLRVIQRESQQAERDARRNPEARQELLEHVQQQLRDMLTDEQVAEFDRWLESRESPGPGREAGSERRGKRSREPEQP